MSIDTSISFPNLVAEDQRRHQPYRVCTRCIMDTTDPDIQFDANGECSNCKEYERVAKRDLISEENRERELAILTKQIKEQGRGKEYDCIIGVSGGVDSTYVAYLVKELGLRPLAVHLDNGWDSELAVSNIEKVLKNLGIDLHTYVLDWEEFKDLQIAFLKASVSDAEVPTDHAIGAIIYRLAAEKGISYIISGTNVVTEAILPGKWTYGVSDWRYIGGIHQQFGQSQLKVYPKYSRLEMRYYTVIKKIKVIPILNYVSYVKKDVMHILEHELGWRNYGGKHYESIYTRFFQGYILPTKFNIDKRKAHLSTLICSGQITREAALEEIKHNHYLAEQVEADREYVIKKLGLTEAEFGEIMALPVKTFEDYPNYLNDPVYAFLRKVKKTLKNAVGK